MSGLAGTVSTPLLDVSVSVRFCHTKLTESVRHGKGCELRSQRVVAMSTSQVFRLHLSNAVVSPTSMEPGLLLLTWLEHKLMQHWNGVMLDALCQWSRH